jgi:hypothetical protein
VQPLRQLLKSIAWLRQSPCCFASLPLQPASISADS